MTKFKKLRKENELLKGILNGLLSEEDNDELIRKVKKLKDKEVVKNLQNGKN